MSQLMDEILRKVRELTDSERRKLIRILNSITNSSEQLPAPRAARVEVVRSIRGKYAHVPTSSDSFQPPQAGRDQARNDLNRRFWMGAGRHPRYSSAHF